ncbi:hypothetical protein JI664_21565 [Rhodobacter sp. NTK016B]|uniref:hypothetical protein n=1 Tax=Rhodobacter sp. NTK016B TaxID=2759676 RepID=UPI001A8E1F7B|nr:hypothetical protein [Rhodobacter sp. NTK016B]MBN8294576.1 hypothetical protein [Rhodobacter sp. NTK016B]
MRDHPPIEDDEFDAWPEDSFSADSVLEAAFRLMIWFGALLLILAVVVLLCWFANKTIANAAYAKVNPDHATEMLPWE